jgi:hypothetical protein
MYKVKIFRIAVLVAVIGASVFYACQKDPDTTILEQTQTINPVQKQAELVGWIVIESDGIRRSINSYCEDEGSECLPNVVVRFICACDKDFIPPADAKPVYNSTLQGGDTISWRDKIVGNLPMHQIVAELMLMKTDKRSSFIKSYEDEFANIIESDNLEKIINGDYVIEHVQKQNTYNEYSFMYILYIADSYSGNAIGAIPISFLYELY